MFQREGGWVNFSLSHWDSRSKLSFFIYQVMDIKREQSFITELSPETVIISLSSIVQFFSHWMLFSQCLPFHPLSLILINLERSYWYLCPCSNECLAFRPSLFTPSWTSIEWELRAERKYKSMCQVYMVNWLKKG